MNFFSLDLIASSVVSIPVLTTLPDDRPTEECRTYTLKRNRLSAPMWQLMRLLSSGHSVCRLTVELRLKGRGTRCLIRLLSPSSTGSLSPSGSVAFPNISSVHRHNWSYPWHKCLT
jgi:hypothetical protein